jgi:hypothetical protein
MIWTTEQVNGQTCWRGDLCATHPIFSTLVLVVAHRPEWGGWCVTAGNGSTREIVETLRPHDGTPPFMVRVPEGATVEQAKAAGSEWAAHFEGLMRPVVK